MSLWIQSHQSRDGRIRFRGLDKCKAVVQFHISRAYVSCYGSSCCDHHVCSTAVMPFSCARTILSVSPSLVKGNFQRCSIIHVRHLVLPNSPFSSGFVVVYKENNVSSVLGVFCDSAPLPVSLDLSGMEMTDACAADLPWKRIATECTAINLSANQLTSFPSALAELDPSRCQKIKCAGNPIPLGVVQRWTSACANVELELRVLEGTPYACFVDLQSVSLYSFSCSRG
jgi:hypothetical protein